MLQRERSDWGDVLRLIDARAESVDWDHPARDVLQEIEWMAATGLGFIDLTLEPPQAASWKVDRVAIRLALERHQLDVVGHTAFYLPIASGIEEIRQASVKELRRCVDVRAARCPAGAGPAPGHRSRQSSRGAEHRRGAAVYSRDLLQRAWDDDGRG